MVNKLINENILPLKVSSFSQDERYLGITHLCQSTHFTYNILQYTRFNWTYYTWPYGKLICLNTTNYLICNMQDFRYWPCTSILDCFGHVVSPLCDVLPTNINNPYMLICIMKSWTNFKSHEKKPHMGYLF